MSSVTPYNNYTVRDLSGNQQPYINSTTEFGYFGNLGSHSTCYSMPTFLSTNNGIATVDASNGLHILQAGIYTLKVSVDCSGTSMVYNTDDGIIYFNFGTNKLSGVAYQSVYGSFGGSHSNKMFSFGSNATTYPGIISWLTNSNTQGPNPTASKYLVNSNNQLLWGYYCNNFSTGTSGNNGPLQPGVCTTKITFIINQPTTIFFNIGCVNANSLSTAFNLTMGKSYFTLQLINSTYRPPPPFTGIGYTYTVASNVDSSFYVVTFTGNGTISFTSSFNINIIAVGGGGGGAGGTASNSRGGGGGGGGGVGIINSFTPTQATVFNISIGSGGVGSGGNGGNSSFTNNSTNYLTATGGGGGTSNYDDSFGGIDGSANSMNPSSISTIYYGGGGGAGYNINSLPPFGQDGSNISPGMPISLPNGSLYYFSGGGGGGAAAGTVSSGLGGSAGLNGSGGPKGPNTGGNSTGQSASSYGSGGGGAGMPVSGISTGGAGASGVVIIYFTHQ
jgi:hypothetical protein